MLSHNSSGEVKYDAIFKNFEVITLPQNATSHIQYCVYVDEVFTRVLTIVVIKVTFECCLLEDEDKMELLCNKYENHSLDQAERKSSVK